MNVTYIQVTIEPWIFGNRPEKEVKIRVRVDGQEFNDRMIMRPDDFEADFDRYMEFATIKIKNAVNGKLIGQATK